MDFHPRQWRRNEKDDVSDQQQQQQKLQALPSAKQPRLLLLDQQQPQPPPSAALPLFAHEPSYTKISNILSAYYSSDDSTPSPPTRLPSLGMMGSFFSMAQWQELELQALIFRHMLAGAPIPPDLLLLLVKKNVFNPSPPPHYHHPLQHLHSSQLFQSGYWGIRGAMDPEPGRCRRTDGKKWRCSRNAVSGQKYCDRHVNRGRNRSRKPVEIPTPAAAVGGVLSNPAAGMTSEAATHLDFTSASSSVDLLHLNHHRRLGPTNGNKSLFGSQNEVGREDDKPGSQVLRHFFDDWPRSFQEAVDNGGGSNRRSVSYATSLSISMLGNPSSDFSLKLSTGTAAAAAPPEESQEPRLSRAGSWATASHMGGPLAEALRSSTSSSSTSSPTSVLHQLTHQSTSDASHVNT